MKSSKTGAILALMLVLFIDGMGQGIIFPILTSTIINPHATRFFHDISQTTRHFWYGLLVGIYYLMWFISAPILGDWSDFVGRKKALFICLFLASIGFLLSAIAFSVGSLFILLIGRFLGGVASGDQAIAKASVIDICPKTQKTVYIGLILASVTLGLVIGPLIGALLQNSALVSWFSVQTPFYFALLLSIVNLFLLQIFFVEKTKVHSVKKIRFAKAITLLVEAFKYKIIRLLLISYCLTQIGWQIFYIATPNYTTQNFNMTATEAGSILALIGIGIGIGLSVLPYWFRKINHKSVAIVAYMGLAISILLIILINKPLVLWVIVVPIAGFFGLAAANVLTLFSNYTTAERQGWIMGLTGSVVAFTGGIGALMTGFLSAADITAPYWVACASILIGLIIFACIRNS